MLIREDPHDVAFPFRRNAAGDDLIYNDKDNIEEDMDCVEVLLRTPLGSREELPAYGVRPQEFTMGGASVAEIRAAISLWEPDADVTIEREPELLDALLDRLRITVRSRRA